MAPKTRQNLMPSFFVNADAKGPKSYGGGPTMKKKKAVLKRSLKDGDDKDARLSRRQRMMQQTELSSDEEDSLGVERSAAASEDEYEDAHDRGYRQAKALLAKLQDEKKDDAEVEEALKADAAEKAGTLRRELADKAELRDEEEIKHRAHRFTPLCVALAPCGKFVISSGKESSIVKFSLVEKKVVGVIKRSKTEDDKQKAHNGHIFAVAVSTDGRYIVSGGHDAVIKVWDFTTLAHVKDLAGHRAPITAFCFQLRSQFLFSASKDRSVKIWDLDQLGLVDTMYGHFDAVMGISALRKQRVVTAGAQDRSCRLWKVEDESQLLFNGPISCGSMDCVAMLNDEHFVSGSSDGSLYVWSLWKKRPIATRREIHGRIPGSSEARWICAVAAVPFSDLVATGSSDGDVKLWKISDNFKKISQVFAYSVPGFVNCLQFSEDGRLLSIAAGQEHKQGRWWVDKEARNHVLVIPVHYGDDETVGLANAESTAAANLMGDSTDEESEGEAAAKE